MPAPKPKTQGIIERVNSLLFSEHRDPLEVARIKRDSRTLLESDPAGHWLVQGALAAIEGDEAKVRESFGNALRLRPDGWEGWYGYAAAFLNMGLFREGRDIAVQGHERFGPIPMLIELIIDGSVKIGRLQEAENWLTKYQELRPEREYEDEEKLHAITSFAREIGLSDDQVELLLGQATGIASSARVTSLRPDYRIQADDEDQWLSVQIELPLPPAAIVDLNEVLAKSVAELDEPSPPLEKLNVMFIAS